MHVSAFVDIMLKYMVWVVSVLQLSRAEKKKGTQRLQKLVSPHEWPGVKFTQKGRMSFQAMLYLLGTI